MITNKHIYYLSQSAYGHTFVRKFIVHRMSLLLFICEKVVVLEVECRASHMLGERSATEPQPRPGFLSSYIGLQSYLILSGINLFSILSAEYFWCYAS